MSYDTYKYRLYQSKNIDYENLKLLRISVQTYTQVNLN